MVTSSTSSFIAGPPEGLPAAAAQIYSDAAERLSSGGADADMVCRAATRQVRHAGYYNTGTGWKQLGPDVRDKINIRQAHKQPDGTYAVFGVDVFHPNATKGTDDEQKFNAQRINTAIANTNKHINDGGPAPGLTKGHPNGIIESPAFGKCTHFSESPKGPGWMRCDLVDVSPDMYADWCAGKYIGFSAGFVGDANNLNLRVGHVAALGGSGQALPKLTYTEIYAADDQLCFSAVPLEATKGRDMKNYAAMKNAHTMKAAAFAAAEAGDPGAEEKMAEADEAMKEAMGDEYMEDGAAAPVDTEAVAEAVAEKVVEAITPDAPVETEADMAADPTEPMGDPPTIEVLEDDEDESAKGDEQFSAKVKAKFAAMDAENKNLRQAVASLMGDKFEAQIDSYLAEKTRAGHKFDAPTVKALMQKSWNDKDAIAKIKTIVENSPVETSLTADPTFAAEGASPIGSDIAALAAQGADVLKLLQTHGGLNKTFSAEDVKWGDIASDA
jgi:hypothetical protein